MNGRDGFTTGKVTEPTWYMTTQGNIKGSIVQINEG